MNITRKQQDEAAREELRARGVSEERIAELDRGVERHVQRQGQYAPTEVVRVADNFNSGGRRLCYAYSEELDVLCLLGKNHTYDHDFS